MVQWLFHSDLKIKGNHSPILNYTVKTGCKVMDASPSIPFGRGIFKCKIDQYPVGTH